MFDELSINNLLFEHLIIDKPKWWENLICYVNKQILVIHVRKANYIDVYYNGGCIISELKYNSNKYQGKIHYEYIPLESSKDYIPYEFSTSSVAFDKKAISILQLENFCEKDMKKIEKRIEKFYPKESEKAIQHKFILNDQHFIDAELAYSGGIRIDLVRVDISLKKIVFVEVKTMGDERLYNDEIVHQLQKYNEFISKNKDELLNYYKKVFIIKKSLGILPKGIDTIVSLDGYNIEEKPLLLFGNCEQHWINNNSQAIDQKIKPFAIGSYYFGAPEYNCDIVSKSKANRHIFI